MTPTPAVNDRLLRPDVVADMLGVQRRTVLKMINEGRLKAIDISQGRRPTWRVPQSEVERYIREGDSTSREVTNHVGHERRINTRG